MGNVLFSIKIYLSELETLERRREDGNPDAIPTHEELAAAIGVHPTTFSRMVNNRRKDRTLDALATIIDLLRERGFDTHISDLIAYRPD